MAKKSLGQNSDFSQILKIKLVEEIDKGHCGRENFSNNISYELKKSLALDGNI